MDSKGEQNESKKRPRQPNDHNNNANETPTSNVNLTLSRSQLVSILAALHNDRVKKKHRLLLVKTLLDASNETIDTSEYIVVKPPKKKSRTNPSNSTVGATTATTATTSATTATTSATTATAATLQPPFQPMPSPNQTAHVALIGCGEISRLYINCLIGKQQLILAWVYDIDPNAAQALAQEINLLQQNIYGNAVKPCTVLSSLDALRPDTNTTFQHVFVLNLTPPSHHYSINKFLLEIAASQPKIKGIWSEKPLTSTYLESCTLVDLARQHNVRLGCSPITYFGAAQQTLVQRIQEIGTPRIVHCNLLCGGWMDHAFRTSGWSKHRRFGIGSLRDVGVYPIALLTCLFGRCVSATAASIAEATTTNTMDAVVSAVDAWMVRLGFENGVVAHITSSLSLSAPGSTQAYNMVLRGDAGTLTMNAMWNNNTTLTFVPERVEDGNNNGGNRVGRPTAWPPITPPYVATHGIGHPHACDWSIGLETMVKQYFQPPSSSSSSASAPSSASASATSSAAFDGTHAAHVVEVLELCEKSSSHQGTLQQPTSTFVPFNRPATTTTTPSSTPSIAPSINTNIIFGTMRLKSAEHPLQLLDTVWDMGCHTFDVGHVYGKDVEGLVGTWWSKHRQRQGGCPEHRTVLRKELCLIGKGGHPFHNSSHLGK